MVLIGTDFAETWINNIDNEVYCLVREPPNYVQFYLMCFAKHKNTIIVKTKVKT